MNALSRTWFGGGGGGEGSITLQIDGKHFDFQSLQFFHWQVVCVLGFLNCRTFLQEKEKVSLGSVGLL